MPRGDGTGPQGMGAGTGRGLGRCKIEKPIPTETTGFRGVDEGLLQMMMGLGSGLGRVLRGLGKRNNTGQGRGGRNARRDFS